jgi:putative transposase
MNELAEYASLLKEEYKKCRDVRELTRYQALYLVASGYTYLETAFIICKDKETVSAWVKKYLEEKTVKDKPKEGRPPVITKEIEEEMTKIIDENDPSNGEVKCTIVDCQVLQLHIFDKYGIGVSQEAIRKRLKLSGYHYAKSEYEFTKRDNENRKQFLLQIGELLKQEGIDVNFMDEMRAKLHPKPGYFWTKNKRPIVKTHCSHKGLTVKGAINPITGDVILNTYDKNDRFAHFSFMNDFIEKKRALVESGKVKQVILNMDNLSVHKVFEVKYLVENTPWLKVNYQPTYSPDLNLIEWLWGHLRRKNLNGQVFQSMEALKKGLEQIFRGLTSNLIKNVCSIAILERQAQKIGIT